MAVSVKISQLLPGGSIQSTDELPISRAGLETFKIAASQIVTTASNVGAGTGQMFLNKLTTGSGNLQFRSLSGADGLAVANSGNTLVISASGQNPVKTSITGNGTTTTFAVNEANSINANNYRVDIDGVLQEPLTDYTISGSNIVFSTPPPAGGKVTVVSNNLVKAYDIIPSDGSVTTNKIVDQAVTTNKLALSSVTTNIINNGAVTNDKLSLPANASQIKRALNADNLPPIYACRAWVQFSGVTATNGLKAFDNTARLIRGQGNVSSVMRNGTGEYTITFTTPMPNNAYAVFVSAQGNATQSVVANGGIWRRSGTAWGIGAPAPADAYNDITVNSIKIFTENGANALFDADLITVSIFV